MLLFIKGRNSVFHLQGDEAIGENNGYYSVSSGKMIQGYQMGKEYVCVTISELTALVLKDLHPLYEPDVGLILKAHLHS